MQNDLLKNIQKFDMLPGLFPRIPLSGIRGKNSPFASSATLRSSFSDVCKGNIFRTTTIDANPFDTGGDRFNSNVIYF